MVLLTACLCATCATRSRMTQDARYIATVHRVGYRFMATVSGKAKSHLSDQNCRRVVSVHAQQIVESRQAEDFLVGRVGIRTRKVVGERRWRGNDKWYLSRAGRALAETTLVEGFLSRASPIDMDHHRPKANAWNITERDAVQSLRDGWVTCHRRARSRNIASICSGWLVQDTDWWMQKYWMPCGPGRNFKGRMLRELVEGLRGAFGPEQPVVVVFEETCTGTIRPHPSDGSRWIARRPSGG